MNRVIWIVLLKLKQYRRSNMFLHEESACSKGTRQRIFAVIMCVIHQCKFDVLSYVQIVIPQIVLNPSDIH